jgi:hypothetical protein
MLKGSFADLRGIERRGIERRENMLWFDLGVA